MPKQELENLIIIKQKDDVCISQMTEADISETRFFQVKINTFKIDKVCYSVA